MAHKAYNLIQWNCRGLRGSREDIELLIHKHNPIAICLQEVLVKKDIMKNDESLFNFKNYNCYYSCTESGSGGVGLLIKDKFSHSPIPLNTNLQAIAVRIHIEQRTYSLCSRKSKGVDTLFLQNPFHHMHM